MNQFAGQKQRQRCREETYGHQGGKAGLGGGGGGGGMNWEIGIDMYTLICIKQITKKNLLYKKINKIKFKNLEKQIPKKPVPLNAHFEKYCPIVLPNSYNF